MLAPSLSHVDPLRTNAVSGCCNALAPFSGLLDHLVGERQQRRRHFDLEQACSMQIYDELKLSRAVHWPVRGPSFGGVVR